MHRALLGFAALSAALTVSTPALALDRALVGTPNAPADRFGASPGFRGDLCRESRRDRDGEERGARAREHERGLGALQQPQLGTGQLQRLVAR